MATLRDWSRDYSSEKERGTVKSKQKLQSAEEVFSCEWGENTRMITDPHSAVGAKKTLLFFDARKKLPRPRCMSLQWVENDYSR